MDGLVLNEQHAADSDRAANLIAGRQVLIGDAFEIGPRSQAVLVADERGAVAAGNDFHAAVFRGGIDQGNPKIDHEGFFRVGLQIAQVLVPRHHSGVLVGQFGAQVELRMSQYFGADHGFDNVEQRRLGQNGEHALSFELAVDLAQQRGRVGQLRVDVDQALGKRQVCVQLRQFASSVSILSGGIDNGVDFGDEAVEDSRVDDILDKEIAFGAIEVELVGGKAAHGIYPFVGGLVRVWLLPSLWSSPWSASSSTDAMSIPSRAAASTCRRSKDPKVIGTPSEDCKYSAPAR